ncbi:GSCOCG00001408001-RA-CDS [Cotesia congregata]|nr:GSCOCG00001408001-RA-CDS [Cotesia congregata]
MSFNFNVIINNYQYFRFGRRTTLLSSVIPSTLGWILIATGQSVEMFYVARFIFGVALSISFAVLPMYCGEIAETSIRGILGSFLQLFITVGLLWAYSIGPYVSYTSFWISCAALPIAFFVLFFTMPESPYYLAAKGRKEDVISALVRLRGKSKDAITDLFTIKANFKALIFTCLLVIFQQMTGINVVLFYSENIFASAGNSGISSSIETIIVGIVQFLASGVTPLVVDRLGRKILLIISGTGTAISLGILGLFFYLKDEAKNDVSNIGWLPIASLIIFIATYSIGWGPLPWTVMGEMFSTEVKSKASGIVVFACWFLGFLITKYFSNIAAAWGQYTAFWLFGVFCVLSVLFTVFILPETKVNLCVMGGGAIMVWSSPILLMLQSDPVEEDNPLDRPITDEEASWIGALSPMGTLVGCLFPGYLAEKLGRRTTLLSSIIPMAISWGLVFTAKSIEALYAARFIGGLAIAIPFGVIPVYCGEIAEPSIRGILGSFFQIFITLGLLWAYSIGPFVSYTNYCIACAVLPIAFFISFYPMPESPYYLAAKSRKEDVIKVLMRLRGKKRAEVEKEATEIEATVQEIYSKETNLMDLIRVKANFKALVLTCLLITFQQLSGIVVVLFYSEVIFESAGKFSLSTSTQTILVSLVQCSGSCFNPLVVDRVGRRILLVISSAGAAICLGILGMFFYLKDAAKSDVSNLGWLPIFSMLAYMVSFSIGLGPVTWIITGEIFSQEIKAKASTIFVFICFVFTFLITRYFVNVASAFGSYTAFWIFAVCCLVCILFTIFILPETKGKTFTQIQAELNGKNR